MFTNKLTWLTPSIWLLRMSQPCLLDACFCRLGVIHLLSTYCLVQNRFALVEPFRIAIFGLHEEEPSGCDDS